MKLSFDEYDSRAGVVVRILDWKSRDLRSTSFSSFKFTLLFYYDPSPFCKPGTILRSMRAHSTEFTEKGTEEFN